MVSDSVRIVNSVHIEARLDQSAIPSPTFLHMDSEHFQGNRQLHCLPQHDLPSPHLSYNSSNQYNPQYPDVKFPNLPLPSWFGILFSPILSKRKTDMPRAHARLQTGIGHALLPQSTSCLLDCRNTDKLERMQAYIQFENLDWSHVLFSLPTHLPPVHDAPPDTCTLPDFPPARKSHRNKYTQTADTYNFSGC